MKDPNAKLNTHMLKIKGYTSTLHPFKIFREPYVIRFTSDEHGETLSIENGSIQLSCKYSDILKLVDETRADRRFN